MNIPPFLLEKYTRILLIESQTLMRTGLRLLISEEKDLKVVGETANPLEALTIAKQERPDIILLGIDVQHRGLLELISDLRSAVAESRILVLIDGRDQNLCEQAVMLGALGIVFKDDSAEILLEAIRRIRANEVWLDTRILARVISGITNNSDQKVTDAKNGKGTLLTNREREVVSLITEGLKNQQVADRLFICEVTVRHHLTSIFAKLGVSNRLELMAYVYKHGLVLPEQNQFSQGR
jgi:two-component system nitrate/nitrite response regulator NarL